MAGTEEINIIGKADMKQVEKELTKIGVTFAQFGNHLTNNFQKLKKMKNGTWMVSQGVNKLDKSIKQLTRAPLGNFAKKLKEANVAGMSLGRMGIPLDTFSKAMGRAGISAKQFQKAMPDYQDMGGGMINRVTGEIMTYGNAVNQAAIKSRRFKFEWLSIMFAGMALDRAFGGLMRTQMQLFGVTESMSAMWTVVLLPIMEAITPLIFTLIEAFMNMPEGMKLAVGAGVLFFAILGKIMLIGGQMMLFFGGLKVLAPGVFIAMKAGVVALGAALLPVLLILAAVVIVVIGIWLAWKSNFMKIRENISAFVEGIKQWFGGIIGIIKGIMKIVKGIFTGDFELVKKGIIQVFTGINDFIIGGFKASVHAIIILFKGLAKIIWNIFKVVVDAIMWVADKVAGVFGKSVDFRMPKFQQGGLVTETGPAILHRGERVVPKGRGGTSGEVMFAPTINLTTTVNNDMDVRLLAEKLNRYWANDFQRLMQGGGSY